MLLRNPRAAWLVVTSLLPAAASDCPSTIGETPKLAGPPPSAGHALVYDDSLGAVLLVNAGLGGEDDASRAGQRTAIWAWRDRHWVMIDSTGPPLRNLAAVAYDSRRNALVIHGGSGVTATAYPETWEWKTAGWRLRAQNGPGLRDHTAMAYDAARGRSVLFSGQITLESFPRDTWEWDGAAWSLVSETGPVPRVHHAMTYDPIRRQVVVFGGYQPNVTDLGDLWAWDGTRWQQLADGPPRTHAALAFHDRLEAVAVIGGMAGSAPPPVMTLWRNGQWTQPSAGPVPPARYLAGAAFDRNRGVLVVFGGGNPAGSNLLADTWEHDGTQWTRISP